MTQVMLTLDREEVEKLASLAEMEPAVAPEVERERGLACFSGPVQTQLGDKLREALDQPSPQSFTTEQVEAAERERLVDELASDEAMEAAARASCQGFDAFPRGTQREAMDVQRRALQAALDAIPIQTPPASESFTLYRYAGSQAWQVAGEDFKPGRRTEVIEVYTVPPESYTLEQVQERLKSDDAKEAAWETFQAHDGWHAPVCLGLAVEAAVAVALSTPPTSGPPESYGVEEIRELLTTPEAVAAAHDKVLGYGGVTAHRFSVEEGIEAAIDTAFPTTPSSTAGGKS